jgi:hypothetical protein
MQKTDTTPMWVYLAFSSISTRKGAMILIWVSLVFTLYCLPWARLFSSHEVVRKIFLIEDWSWFAMMVPVLFWYWISLKWVDKHSGWAEGITDSEEQV